MSDPAELSLADLAAAIRRRKVSSAEVTKALLARIKKWQPKINAFARVEAEDAMKAARAADRALANGKIRGPLHGVPLAHKDMYYVKGKLSECGSKIRKGWIAPATATALVKLEAAGAFRLGALNMVEFAFGPTGHNVHTGHVRNPWIPRMSPAAPPPARAPRSARGLCPPRSAPTPAVRSACPHTSAASPG